MMNGCRRTDCACCARAEGWKSRALYEHAAKQTLLDRLRLVLWEHGEVDEAGRGAYPGRMTTYRELFVRNIDGTGGVERVERDDSAGRRSIDQAAFAALQRPGVTSAEARPVDRIAGTRSKGRYR